MVADFPVFLSLCFTVIGIWLVRPVSTCQHSHGGRLNLVGKFKGWNLTWCHLSKRTSGALSCTGLLNVFRFYPCVSFHFSLPSYFLSFQPHYTFLHFTRTSRWVRKVSNNPEQRKLQEPVQVYCHSSGCLLFKWPRLPSVSLHLYTCVCSFGNLPLAHHYKDWMPHVESPSSLSISVSF